MRIGIIGTRGIPNHYGGFEQFAEQLSVRMAALGHEVVVYCSGNHSYQRENFQSVQLIHCFDPENIIGTSGQFIYDFNCIMHSRKQNFDLVLQLGYTSSSVWSWLFPANTLIVTNMDGLEWMRSKYNPITRRFLARAEKWAVENSNYLIADSTGIQKYLKEKYNAHSWFIPYGADIYLPESNDRDLLDEYNLVPGTYDLLIARFEPENNIETILKVYREMPDREIVLIGNYKANSFGRRIFGEYKSFPNIRFAGAIFDSHVLNAMRYNSALYLHGHSVGGTNPSLLEAMAGSALICAHDNIFNRAVLGNDGYYFTSASDLFSILRSGTDKKNHAGWLANNLDKINELYNWNHLTRQTENLFKEWIASGK